MFKLESTDQEARTGILKTRHGKVQTPFLMPCATRTVGKCIGTDDYNAIGNKAIIVNAFVTFLRPGLETIKAAGGLHKFMKFHKTIFTDSGGFQVMRSFHQKTTKNGLVMQDPWTKQIHRITPEKMMEIEQSIQSDVAMCLDDMPLATATKEEVIKAIENTHVWARRCKEAHDEEKQLLFGICQGGKYKDLREKSAKVINGLDFDGVAIGGVAIGESRENVWKAVNYALPFISPEKPRYLMGVGKPSDILDAVERGIDCFDSVFPTQNARHGRMFTWKGNIDLRKGKYKFDQQPIEAECKCMTCNTYSRSYLRHLLNINEPTFKRYASIHNITFMQSLMKEIRLSIKEQRFQQLKKSWQKNQDLSKVR